MSISLWLDDERPAPPGWVRCWWPEDVYAYICNPTADVTVDVLSLDHDLGDDSRGTGYDVLKTIEELIVTGAYVNLPQEIRVHSANPVGRRRMEQAISVIKRFANPGK